MNYASGLLSHREAANKGYNQVLWLLGDDCQISEAGILNFFVVVKRDNGGDLRCHGY
jgi:branched-chain amino acid aminotransferase